MNLKLLRSPSEDGTTFGELYLDGDVFECLTLEDEIRPYPDKVPGETCIWGDRTYEIVLDYSPKFGRNMPHVIGVDLFTGIRMHPGKDKNWTEGCILTGLSREGEDLIGYQEAFDRLVAKMEQAVASGERMFLTIVNPVEALKPAA